MYNFTHDRFEKIDAFLDATTIIHVITKTRVMIWSWKDSMSFEVANKNVFSKRKKLKNF